MRRLTVLALMLAAVAGCGEGGDQAGNGQALGGGELVVTVPPISPTEPTAQEPAPKAGFESVAAVEPALVPPPVATSSPPPKAVEPEPEPAAQVEVALAPTPDPAAPAQTEAVPEGAATVPQPQPTGTAAWAGYLRKAGFPCQRVASTNRIDRPSSAGLQFYKVDCEGGASYQATNKRGHLFFRRWRG